MPKARTARQPPSTARQPQVDAPPPTARQPPLAEGLKALANHHRLTILTWLADPERNFPPQREASLVEDGVCVSFITEKIGLAQPTVTAHMQALARADLVTSRKIKNWVYYRLNGPEIDELLRRFASALGRA